MNVGRRAGTGSISSGGTVRLVTGRGTRTRFERPPRPLETGQAGSRTRALNRRRGTSRFGVAADVDADHLVVLLGRPARVLAVRILDHLGDRIDSID